MKRLRWVAMLGTCLAVLALCAGCGVGPNTNAPGAVVDQSAADDIALQAVVSLDGVNGDFAGSIGGSSAPPARSERVGTLAAAWDTTYTTDKGLTFSVSRTFYDAEDNALPGWSPSAVRLHRTSSATGTITSPRDTASISHQAAFDVRGIQAEQDTLTFDGTALDTLLNRAHSLDGTKSGTFHCMQSLDVAGVRILKSTRDTNGKPFAGTITMIVSVDVLRSGERGSVEKHFNATVVVVFGTDGADVTVNGGFRYRWNPLTGVISRA